MSKNATSSKTFGYKRFEVLALFNGVTLFVISIVIIVEAIKIFAPPEVQSTEMFIISLIGLIS